MTYTNTQLQQVMAKMLPEYIEAVAEFLNEDGSVRERAYAWKYPKVRVSAIGQLVTDMEWLHLCWLVEERLSRGGMISEYENYNGNLGMVCSETNSEPVHATWQQRTIALAPVKGIEIV